MSGPTNETSADGELGNENAAIEYEPVDNEGVTTAILIAVSDVSDTSITELEPLYSVIDPDALDALFASRDDGTPRDGDGYVTFAYGSYQVRVEDDDRITVLERE